MKKELILGGLVGGLVFLGLEGYNIFPILFVAGLIGVAMYSNGTRSKSFAVVSGTNAKQSVIHFEDIGGQETAKKELTEALNFIKNSEEVKKLGIRPLKGILLTGPPGTGKTLLAKAAAQYIDSVFIAVGGSDFVEMYVGVGAKRIREMFKQARQMAHTSRKNNAVIFIDEIDVLGGKRGGNAGHMEYDQTLNALLVEMDGISADEDVRVLVVAATNRVDILDPALLRPGRFDRQVKVDLPDKEGRLHILQLHMRNKPLAEEVNIDRIAEETYGFSGAHLESLVNESAILALRSGSSKIEQQHLTNAIDKVMMGEKLERKPSNDELYRIAVHEIGHALMSEYYRPGSVATVTVMPRGNALGYMRQNPQGDLHLYTEKYLKEQIAVLIAGSVTEKIMTGCRSTGAENDFRQAASMSKQIIFSGMSSLGIVSQADIPAEILHETTAKIIAEIEQKAVAILNPMQHKIEHTAQVLIEKEVISGEICRQMIGNNNEEQIAS